VNPRAENVYAGWRTQFVALPVLRDENGLPSERLLQAVWQHQRLLRDRLETTDGKAVRIFHPGFISLEGGPDFRGALIQTGDEAPRSGDVEIDLHSSGWRAHGHDRNPNFSGVLLHVVWDEVGVPASGGPAKSRSKTEPQVKPPPVLALHNCLDAPLAELSQSLENEPLRALPESLRGKCCAPLRGLDETQLTKLLCEAAWVRFEAKAEQFRARARHAGWEQVLWENLFRALGYKHNIWPMQHLAELKSSWSRDADSAFELQARLLGVSGLLPDELTRAQRSTDNYLRRVWDCWWRERDEFAGCRLPRAAWKFHGLRPANHPQRRLALAAHWLANEKFVSKIEGWITPENNVEPLTPAFPPPGSGRETSAPSRPGRQISAAKMVDSLRKILEVERDEFWSWHWTFRSARMQKPSPLLGEARVTDLAVNVVLPWLWVRAMEGGNEKLRHVLEQRYFAWPPAEDNSVLKLARQRLLGVGKSRALRTAAAQQGLLQIVRDFCENSNAACENCRFPELVRSFGYGSAVQSDDKKC